MTTIENKKSKKEKEIEKMTVSYSEL